jgi:hypothetical protein
MSTPRRTSRLASATTRINLSQIIPIEPPPEDDIIHIENPQPDVNNRNNYNVVALKISEHFNLNFIDNLPKAMIKTITTLAHKHAVHHSRITNLEKQITELTTHKTNQTTPEFIIKQYKNILTKPEEAPLKAALMISKIEQLIHQRQVQLIETITIFNARFNDLSTATELSLRLFRNSPVYLNPAHVNIALPSFLDFNIINKLCDFDSKQAADRAKKEAKKKKLEEHRATNITTMATSKDIQKINKQLKQLTIKTTKALNKTSKSPKSPKKVHFQKGKQKKSQSASNNKRKRNRNVSPRRNGN